MSGHLDALCRRHGIATAYGERAVPDATKRLILTRLGVEIPDDEPHACHLPEGLREAPAWGLFCQLYELRSGRGWGIGDFTDLAELAGIAGRAGADFLGINPLHALLLGDPGTCSPFSPSSRRFLNPLYIDPEALPGWAEAGQEATGLSGEVVDYAAVTRTKLAALRAVHAARPFGKGPWAREAHDDFVASGGEALHLHTLFEALSLAMVAEGHGATFGGWPEPLRDARGPAANAFAEEQAEQVAFHLWLQWVADVQLAAAARAARAAGMRIGLYLDLAVAEAQGGSAAWGDPGLAMPGLSVGAPPDVFAAEGQDWGLAAPSPVAMEATGFSAFRGMIRAQLRHAGALRIDHAMALRQLFLIPWGEPPSAGAHLRYPMEDLLAVLGEESRANAAVVIGEDLGFVPDGFREVLEAARILSYRILYFEQEDEGDALAFAPPAEWPAGALACVSTHDLPTLAGWWAGEDIALRREHGLVGEAASAEHVAHRQAERAALLRLLSAEGLNPGEADEGGMPPDLPVAVHRLLARTPSVLVGVRLADLVGPAAPTNLPGTTEQYPNWRLRSPTPLAEIESHPLFHAVTQAMRDERPRPSESPT